MHHYSHSQRGVIAKKVEWACFIIVVLVILTNYRGSLTTDADHPGQRYCIAIIVPRVQFMCCDGIPPWPRHYRDCNNDPTILPHHYHDCGLLGLLRIILAILAKLEEKAENRN
ncbi:hypothetical protein K7X08_035887 [Anisodus acutangulus]|uniref:Uncharacterized protein n=1 Tax=Anisodus acutangulus TaxID=402998 RepID=A0A9Q1L500_9SOLA|nr:hypothetical protein K7X08_035887 [Anisodus acutangulus]